MLMYLTKSKGLSRKQITLDFYLGGFILCGFANIFLFQMSPENWGIGLNGWITVVARAIAWVLVCSFSALAYGALGYCLSSIKLADRRIFILPLLFPVAEVLRSYLFAAMAYGPNGSLSPNFNWGSLAVPASGTILVYSSRIIGFFGLTFITVLVNLALFLLIKRRIYPSLMILCAVALVTTLGWKMGDNQQNSRKILVSSVHLSETDDMKTTDKSLSPPSGTDVLVLPEYSGIEQDKQVSKYLSPLSSNGVAITSIVNGRSPKGTNRIIYLSKDGRVSEKQDKTFLIPTGELLPYSLQASFKTIGRSSINEDFRYTQQLERGKQPERIYVTKDGIAIGTLACSGVSALNEYSRLTNEGADVLVNTASLAFLQPNSLYHVYARNMARFQAVSNNRPFVQSSRSGQSYILDNQGKALIESTGQNKQILSAELYIRK